MTYSMNNVIVSKETVRPRWQESESLRYFNVWKKEISWLFINLKL